MVPNVKSQSGMTLLEVMIAIFILLVGIMGVLAAIPVGVTSAGWVIFQDAAIHLSHSKFSEFRRDRVSPDADLVDGSAYLPNSGAFVPGRQEPKNGSAGGWRDFAHGIGQPYQYFDDIERYEWKVESEDVFAQDVSSPVYGNYFVPAHSGVKINLKKITVVVHLKGTSREFRFAQYICAYVNK